MKTFTLLSLSLLPLFSLAQTPDSTVIKQVDSLIQISRTLTGQGDFDKALEVNAAAEKLALEKLGRESAGYGSCCFNHGRVLYFKRDYPEAEKWYLESKAIREKAVGKYHSDYAWSLNNLAILYRDIGQYDKAETLYLESKAIREKALGKEHPDYAGSLLNLANLYSDMGQYEKTETLYLEAKAIREKTVGNEHPLYAASLNSLASLYWHMGQYDKAETLHLEAKAIREKALGKEHPDYAQSLNNLANLYENMGQYEKAEPLYLEAKAIREKALGKEHPLYAASLNNLASLYWYMGQYDKAETPHLEAKTILEKALGKEHPDYAASLHNLANLYQDMGQYEKAETLFLEAKAIREKALGKEHLDYARNLSALANLYSDMGNYEKAEPLYLEDKTIREKALGKEHPHYAQSLNNLAVLHHNMGQYEKAEPLYLEAIVILEKALGKEHPEYAQSLHNLASLYHNMGQYGKAETRYLEAKAIREKALGKEHPLYAGSLNNLAVLYSNMGQYGKAEPLFFESKAIREKALGKEHPDYAVSLNGLANLYGAMGQYEKGKPYYLELSTVNQTLIAKALLHLSEQELNNYLNTFSEDQHHTLSFNQLSGRGMLTAACFDNSLFYKGFLLNASNHLRNLANSSPEATESFNQLKGYGRRLAAQYSLPVSDRDNSLIAGLEEKADQLEKDLTRTVAGFGEARRQVNWQEVQATLKTGEAAIEFVHYRYWDKKQTDSTMYAALLLRPGEVQPLFIPLFEEKQLTAVLTPDNKEQRSELFAQIYSRGAQPLKTTQLTGLYELIWQPLDSLLKNVKTVYFSPSGLLHRINFDAVPIPSLKEGKRVGILSDQFQLVRLGSTRSLVVPDLTKSDATNEALLFGGIQYEMDTTFFVQNSTSQDMLTAHSELSFTYADRSLPQRGESWGYLPGTEKEVSSIHSLLQKSKFSSQMFSSDAASEESFKTIGKDKPSPRILHLATHGFFFPDPQSAIRNPQSDESVFKISDHPMIRSGLILTGGNHAWQTGKPLKPGMDDGILTAYEISQMNLSNTELVVLSACETGLGDIQGNEGVYGLQRAFKIAGAKYLVMSLWQVPDQETSVFMTTFYKNWLEGKMSIPDAFRTTQQEMRERFINPYQWAGFVLVE
ncbi:MAG: tetratricopeptide repeat protein [Saprospiraceae bacterium]|nr:tetratricopeptide repeat protein [Saprospiraceae bacterium]MCF8252066.1 tetratricopeptide repeat protein [Saprospiraceae bacterium]MCF8281772.1 tetratricopeptide repeat protein [Bacteroidales bacterium]MCF8313709.1 tetratricopeptide repeat protein [Saprospiraceae bacterium]MCF8442416.1 tetratricopeptide repeat protein [Saprospiraceae bacterium]